MAQNSGLMQGKRGVILGVANNRSLAWDIAKACHDAGAEIALTWQRLISDYSLTAIAQRAEKLMIDGGHHVDSGYHVLGMKRPEAPDISLSPGKE